LSAPPVRPLIAGNWKMNGLTASLAEAKAVASGLAEHPAKGDVVICPPATLIAPMAQALKGSPVRIGGQDCHAQQSGAFTGDISAAMLADAGASLVILGHSERRATYGETDSDVAAKVEAALGVGLQPLICIGESFEQRQAGRTLEIIQKRLKLSLPDSLAGADFAVAYEPFWAIGTGLTPTLEQIAEVHIDIRNILAARFGDSGAKAPILYGGSVKTDNAAAILNVSEVGGALVGGASLQADDFLKIIRGL
jgi:triosephosphate isomerase